MTSTDRDPDRAGTGRTRIPRIGVLAVQGDVREHLRALTLAGAEAIGVRRERELDQVDALVIPGGESTTIDRLLRVFELDEPIRARLAAGMPAYGSCAGMIMLATEVLDGRPDQRPLGALDITVRRNAFGRQVDSFEADLPLTDLGEDPYRAVFIRAPWVERVGPEVEVLASVTRGGSGAGEDGQEGGDGGEHIVAVRHGSVLATAFHPELTEDHRIHGLFVSMVREHIAGSIPDGAGTIDDRSQR